MNVKIISLFLALALPVLASAAPDDKESFARRHGDKIERLSKALDLSPAQKSKLTDIFKQQREKFKALHEEKRKLIEGILNKEQLLKYQELQKQRRGKWHKNAGGSITNY